jgi:hypothetical protein
MPEVTGAHLTRGEDGLVYVDSAAGGESVVVDPVGETTRIELSRPGGDSGTPSPGTTASPRPTSPTSTSRSPNLPRLTTRRPPGRTTAPPRTLLGGTPPRGPPGPPPRGSPGPRRAVDPQRPL